MAAATDIDLASDDIAECEDEVIRQVLARWERDIWGMVDSRRRVFPMDRDLVVLLVDAPPSNAMLTIHTRAVAIETTHGTAHFRYVAQQLKQARSRKFGEDCLVHLVFVRCGMAPICRAIKPPVTRGKA